MMIKFGKFYEFTFSPMRRRRPCPPASRASGAPPPPSSIDAPYVAEPGKEGKRPPPPRAGISLLLPFVDDAVIRSQNHEIHDTL